MSDDEAPIAWAALESGTPVYARDGDELGKVHDVIADREKDIFSGVTLRSGLFDHPVFVPATTIEELTHTSVTLNISSSEADQLKPYEG